MGKMDKPNTPLVSVIVTTKNEEKNIERFLKSVKNQTYKNLEVIVVDNNSTDRTKAISKKYTNKVFNEGPERSAQRNLGVEKANGEYVFILDADMELTSKVVEDSIQTVMDGSYKVLVIPEKTQGTGFISTIRKFEREMYMGDLSIEVARVFSKKVFKEFGGYDLALTGPEDYDLPYRISKKHKIGRSHEYIYHHEATLTLPKLLKKRFYYAYHGALYAEKHPELIRTQGNFLFRRAYFKHWINFVKNPVTGILFILVKALETVWAIAGFISQVGVVGFAKAFYRMLV